MFFPDTKDIDQSQNPLPLPPNKPTSQKAATMPSEPEPEKVEMVMAMELGMDRETVVRYLKAKQNDVQAAVDAFFEGEDISAAEQATTWDEHAWSTDREGGNGSSQHLRPLAASSTTATRPNSPAPSIGRQNLHPTSQKEADDDLEKALAMSQGATGGSYVQQETGVIGTRELETTFGPATRDQYDAKSWAVVPFSLHESSEVVPDVETEERMLVPGEPRLLKHLPGGDYLANFLTICHAINGAKEALLMREYVQPDYGQDGEWWRGHPITRPKIIHIDDGTFEEPDNDKYDELVMEVQRLMAFLGTSHRSYASVGALTQTDYIKNISPSTTRSGTLLELFIQNWAVAAASKSAPTDDFAAIFSTTVGTNAPEGTDTATLSFINLAVNLGEGSRADLFERLDDLLWDTDAENSTLSDNYIKEPAEVLVMQVYQQDPNQTQLRVEIPAQFYVDKYLPENIESTRAIRLEMVKGKKRVAKIEEIEKRLQSWRHPKNNASLNAKTLLTHTLGHFSGKNRIDATQADKSASATVDDVAEQDPPHYAGVSQTLEQIISSIDSKLAILASEKEKTCKAISKMSKAPPPGLENDDLDHRYTLRGVATKPNITYVLRAIDPDEDISDDAKFEDDCTPGGMRWWRIEYEVNASGSEAKVTKTRMPDYDVLRAVELEYRSALLVYASDDANSELLDNRNLPPPLREFVDRDNQIFADEVREHRSRPPTYSFDMTDVPRESIERPRRSMDSTRAEGSDGDSDIGGGPSPPTYGDPMFADRAGFGMGYDMKQGSYRDDEEDEVHEITLDDEVGGVEMVEKAHDPLTSGLQNGAASGGGVIREMEEVKMQSQDPGVGGSATYVGHAKMK